jgi:hypothetical protein
MRKVAGLPGVREISSRLHLAEAVESILQTGHEPLGPWIFLGIFQGRGQGEECRRERVGKGRLTKGQGNTVRDNGVEDGRGQRVNMTWGR